MRNFLLIKKIIVVVFLCVFVISPLISHLSLNVIPAEAGEKAWVCFRKTGGCRAEVWPGNFSPEKYSWLQSITNIAFAETVDELNKKITDQKGKLEQIDAEIKKINTDLLKTGAEKTTLQSTLKTLEASRKKLEKDINYTQGNISLTNLNINKLSLSINDKNQKIGEGRLAMGKSIRALSEIEEVSPIEVILSNQSMGDLWDYAQALVTVDHEIQGNVRELQGLARELEVDKQASEAKKLELEKQKKLLGSQKQSVEVTKQEKTQVLKETQNKETLF